MKYSSPFGGIPRNWKLAVWLRLLVYKGVPPSGGSLEIGNMASARQTYVDQGQSLSSPFGGIPRNWKPASEYS